MRLTTKVWKRTAQGLGLILVLALLLAAGAGLWLHGRLRASLPILEGEHPLAGLAVEVRIDRDALGIPTIHARNRADLARATGWLHAQERFFQMDLLRRQAAGELAALVGPGALPLDRRHRLHRFRPRAERNLEHAAPRTREILEAYTAGVNAGLEALGAAPPEYLLLRVDPEPWRVTDSLLVLFAMYFDLQGGTGRRESELGRLRECLPEPLFDFLVPRGTVWDAPIAGSRPPDPPLPAPDVIDLRAAEPLAATARRSAGERAPVLPGSNNWALAGSRTASGAALLANDMHLGLRLPNVWYRASFVWTETDRPEPEHHVTGATLPGTPAMVVGSNGRVAWGFTNSYGDWIDLVVLESDSPTAERYRTPDGWRPFERHAERIDVRGGQPETLEVRETIWGPVLGQDDRGRLRAIRWVAHDPRGANFRLTDLERAADVDEAIGIARQSGIPAQNLVAADDGGRIAWTVMGVMPRRFGHDGTVPVSWADGTRGWDGWLDPAEHPTVVDPADGRIWTANNRVMAGTGPADIPLGARAAQIRDALMELDRATPADMLAIQLDDRALFLERWRDLLLETLTPAALAGNPSRAELRSVVEQTWTGRASIDSAGYRMVRAFRLYLAEQVFAAILAPSSDSHDDLDFTSVAFQWEEPLWRLVRERPAHLLSPRFATWDEQLLAAADYLLEQFAARYEGPLAERTWGERNTVRIGHPLARAVPRLAAWLDLEPVSLPGDQHMPLVQSPSFGASERFAVSPGREEDGYFQMPGGQSGHPFSPFYREGHEAWLNGTATPFLPGPTEYELTLSPD